MRRPRRTLSTMVCLVALSACSSSDDGATRTDDDAPPIPSVTVPPERLTPFCESMIDLADELERDPPDDIGARILETYLEIVEQAPPEIEDDFRAVIAALQAGDSSPSVSVDVTDPEADAGIPTTAPLEDFDAEGRLPGDSAGERVNDYVSFVCRSSANNPGPPATQPLDDVELEDDTDTAG